MTGKTLLCLGSGLAPRYKSNTLQALALPLGSHLQFRYEAELVPEGLHKGLEGRTLNGTSVLVGYVDCTLGGKQADGRCLIVPYRRAELLDSRRRGSIFILTLKLLEFSRAPNLETFQLSLDKNVPRWKLTPQGQPVFDSQNRPQFEGFWCHQVSDLQLTVTSDRIGDWQELATQLRTREDFSTQPYFLLVEGLFRRQEGTRDGVPVELDDGEYRLQSGKDYELRVIHYDPDSDEHTGGKATRWLKVDASLPLLTLRSNPLLAVDSPYDLKSIRFSTGETNRSEYGSLFLHAKDDEEIVPELYFAVSVRGDWWKATRNGLILGILLTATELVTVLSKGNVENWQVVTSLCVLLGLTTGFFVSLGMRKPL
jgi:hypothetical protein